MNSLHLLFFYFFAIIAVTCAIMVIISRNPVHSVFFLILVFFCVAALFLMLQVEFVGMIFLIVYVGAIAILFLFVVMMLNVKIVEINETIVRYLPIGMLIGLVFLAEILLLLGENLNSISLSDVNVLKSLNIINEDTFVNWFNYLNQLSNMEVLSFMLFNYYFIYYLIGGMILFLAMVGAIVLTLNPPSNIKRQEVYDQINESTSIRIVSIK